MKGKTPIFSKALKTLSSARSLLLAGRQNVCVNFTNSALHSDHHSVIKEIARHHRRGSNHNGNRLSLGDISNGNVSNYTNASTDSRTKGLAIKNGEELMGQLNLKNNSNVQVAKFSYIITRPTAFLKDGRSVKKVSASKSVSELLACQLNFSITQI